MYAQSAFKQATIVDSNGTVALRFSTHKGVSDELIYETLKDLTRLLASGTYTYSIAFIQKDIIDHAPEKPPQGDDDHQYTDQELVLKANAYQITNVNISDEAIYGPEFDGINRTARLIWIDSGGAEHFVALDGFDSTIVSTPNGPFSYNSDDKTITFTSMKAYDVTYILRRYKA